MDAKGKPSLAQRFVHLEGKKNNLCLDIYQIDIDLMCSVVCTLRPVGPRRFNHCYVEYRCR